MYSTSCCKSWMNGRLTDNKGRVVNFKNTIIIMTSNLGSSLIRENFEKMTPATHDKVVDETKIQVLELLKKTIRPEFLNRIDDIIMFTPLNEEEIRKIVSLQLEQREEDVGYERCRLGLHERGRGLYRRQGLRSSIRCPSGKTCHSEVCLERVVKGFAGWNGRP